MDTIKGKRKGIGNVSLTEHFEEQVETAIVQNIDFCYEGHFTNEATWDIPRKFKEAGYEIHLIFFG